MDRDLLLAVAQDRLVGCDLQGAREIIERLLQEDSGSQEARKLLEHIESAEHLRSSVHALPVEVTVLSGRREESADVDAALGGNFFEPRSVSLRATEQAAVATPCATKRPVKFAGMLLQKSTGERAASLSEALYGNPTRPSSKPPYRHRWVPVAVATLIVGLCLVIGWEASTPSAVEKPSLVTRAPEKSGDGDPVEEPVEVGTQIIESRPSDIFTSFDLDGIPRSPPIRRPPFVQPSLPEPQAMEPSPPPPEISAPPIDEVAPTPEIQRVAYCGLMLEVVAAYTDNPYLRQSTAILSNRLYDQIGGLGPEARGGLGVGEAFERALAELEESVETGATRSPFVTCITWFGNSPNPDAAFGTAEQAMTRWAGRGYPRPEMSAPVPRY